MSRLQRRHVLTVEKRRAAVYLAGVIIFFAGLLYAAAGNEEAIPAAVNKGQVQYSDNSLWKNIIFSAVPVLEAYQESDSWTEVWNMVYFFADIRPNDLRTIITSEIAYLPEAADKAAMLVSKSDRVLVKPRLNNSPVKNGQVLVGVYHTHTAESFIPTSGRAHSPGGEQGEIVEVGRALVEKLAAEGIGAVQSTTVHDYPSFMRAYGASEATARQMINDNKHLEYIFDIHRDAESRENVITEINGKTTACITIIVAQGQPGLEQPHWEKNYAAAKKLKEKCDERYPGLMRDIQLAEWRYNEHLHNGLLLLEVGSHETGVDEAELAIGYFGEILAEVIRENS